VGGTQYGRNYQPKHILQPSLRRYSFLFTRKNFVAIYFIYVVHVESAIYGIASRFLQYRRATPSGSYKVITWSGGLPDKALYKSGKQLGE